MQRWRNLSERGREKEGERVQLKETDGEREGERERQGDGERDSST